MEFHTQIKYRHVGQCNHESYTKDQGPMNLENTMYGCLNKTLNQIKSQAYRHVGQMNDFYA